MKQLCIAEDTKTTLQHHWATRVFTLKIDFIVKNILYTLFSYEIGCTKIATLHMKINQITAHLNSIIQSIYSNRTVIV